MLNGLKTMCNTYFNNNKVKTGAFTEIPGVKPVDNLAI
jgi:hypothetical protein